MHRRSGDRIGGVIVAAIIVEGPDRISEHLFLLFEPIDHHRLECGPVGRFILQVHPVLSVFRHEHRSAGIAFVEGIHRRHKASVLVDQLNISELCRVIVLIVGTVRNIGHQPHTVQLILDEPDQR